jgi:hypothetical protein
VGSVFGPKENNNDSSNFDLNSNFDLELLTNSQNDTLITDLLANNDGFDDILRNINLNVFQGNIQTNSYTMMARQFPMTFITNSNVTISFNMKSILTEHEVQGQYTFLSSINPCIDRNQKAVIVLLLLRNIHNRH